MCVGVRVNGRLCFRLLTRCAVGLNEKSCSLLRGDVKPFTGVTTRAEHWWVLVRQPVPFCARTHAHARSYAHTTTSPDYFHVPWTNIREALGLLLFAFAERLRYSKGITLPQYTEAELTRWYRGQDEVCICVCMCVCVCVCVVKTVAGQPAGITNTWEKHCIKYVAFIWHIHLHKLTCHIIGSNIECDFLKKQNKHKNITM